MEHNAQRPLNQWDKQKVRPQTAIPFVIPKGWKSMHREVEYSQCLLWPERNVKLPQNERKCLNQFHTKPTRKQEREYAFNGEFNERVTPIN